MLLVFTFGVFRGILVDVCLFGFNVKWSNFIALRESVEGLQMTALNSGLALRFEYFWVFFRKYRP